MVQDIPEKREAQMKGELCNKTSSTLQSPKNVTVRSSVSDENVRMINTPSVPHVTTFQRLPDIRHCMEVNGYRSKKISINRSSHKNTISFLVPAYKVPCEHFQLSRAKYMALDDISPIPLLRALPGTPTKPREHGFTLPHAERQFMTYDDLDDFLDSETDDEDFSEQLNSEERWHDIHMDVMYDVLGDMDIGMEQKTREDSTSDSDDDDSSDSGMDVDVDTDISEDTNTALSTTDVRVGDADEGFMEDYQMSTTNATCQSAKFAKDDELKSGHIFNFGKECEEFVIESNGINLCDLDLKVDEIYTPLRQKCENMKY
eukprot:CFRG5033T1